MSKRIAADQRGQAAVELAIVTPFVLLLLLGIMDFGKAFNYWITQSQVASDAARHAVVTPSLTSVGDLKTYVQKQISIKQLHDDTEVCVAFPNGTAAIGDPIRVKVKFMYVWLPFVKHFGGVSAFTLQRSATMRLEQASAITPVTTRDTCA